MKASALLRTLHEMGLQTEVVGENLHIGPSEKLTDVLRQAIREHKADLMRLLQEAQKGACSETAPSPIKESPLLFEPLSSCGEASPAFVPSLIESRDGESWEPMRSFASQLGKTVTDGTRTYQLWGLTPRGAICFDGSVFRTLDFKEVETV